MPSDSSPARLIQYVGKGGVGKTTLAAATAVAAAAGGHRTLVVSTDRAHSLGDVLATDLGSQPTAVTENLFGQELNAFEDAGSNWTRLQSQLTGFLKKAGISEIQAGELAILPGLDEVAGLAQIAQACRSGDFDCVVVDSGPTGESIRLLSMPDAFQWYATRLQEWTHHLPRLLPALVRRVVPEDSIVEALEQAKVQVREIRALLSDADHSSYRVVLTPDRVVLREAERTETYLNLFEYPLDAVMLNRIPPSAEPSDAFWGKIVERQRQVVAEVHAAFPTIPVLEAPLRTDEPTGSDALAQLARHIFSERDPVAVLHVGPTQRIQKTGDSYKLEISMPHLDGSKLSLIKRGDILHVGIGNVRREIPLPRALAEREATGARVRSGKLQVSFTRSSGTPLNE